MATSSTAMGDGITHGLRRSLGLGLPLRAWLLIGAIVMVALVVALFAFSPFSNSKSDYGGAAQTLSIETLTNSLRHTVGETSYAGVSKIEVEATFATPEYLGAAFADGAIERYIPDGQVAFVLAENLHTDNLPEHIPAMTLTLGDQNYQADFTESKVASVHHRVTVVRFPTTAEALGGAASMTLTMPGGQSMGWDLPIEYDASSTPFGMGWATILAILAGMLASMWPCLFQLTAYFIPALAGLNMQEASAGNVGIGQRLKVFKAALFFVLGFTIIYTAAGAILGFAAGQLGESGVYESIQRWVAFGAGIVVIGLAIRVAAKARAPLVCKMPVVSRMAHQSTGQARPWEMMVAGVAFATGCMTCFGSALVIGMIVYVGMAQSALYGAMILFLFSVGMGVPLVIAGVAMAKILPFLFKLEKMVRWMGIASAVLMLAFGILLISGNYMALSEFIYRLTGSPLPLS